MTRLAERFCKEIYDGETNEGHAGLTSQTISAFTAIYQTVKPSSVLEIGFNAGHSAYLWLNLFPDVNYDSIDICEHEYVEPNANKMMSMFSYFGFKKMNSLDLEVEDLANYDMVFIDGGHDKETFDTDIKKAYGSGVSWILVDDYNHQWCEWIRQACDWCRNSNIPYEFIHTYKYNNQNGDIVECALLRNKRLT